MAPPPDIARLEQAVVVTLSDHYDEDVVKLFLSQRYFEAETRLSAQWVIEESDNGTVRPATRLLWALCVLHRGFHADSLREISMTLETSKSYEDRLCGSIFLYCALMALGRESAAETVMDTARQLDKNGLFATIAENAQNIETKEPLSPDVADYDEHNFKLRIYKYYTRAFDRSSRAKTQYCFRNHASAMTNLLAMFELVVELMPKIPSQPFSDVREIAAVYEKVWRQKNQPIEDGYLVVSDPNKLKEIVILLTIQGFTDLLTREYTSSYERLTETLDLIKNNEGTRSLLYSAMRALAIFRAEALLLSNDARLEKNKSMTVDHLIVDILTWSADLDSGPESVHYFFILGCLYLERSVAQAKISDDNSLTQPSNSCDNYHLRDAIKLFLMAIAMAFDDQVAVSRYLNIVVACCFMHGGFPLRFIWFLRMLSTASWIDVLHKVPLEDRQNMPNIVKLVIESTARARQAFSSLDPTTEEDSFNCPIPRCVFRPMKSLLDDGSTLKVTWEHDNVPMEGKTDVADCNRYSHELLRFFVRTYYDHHGSLSTDLTSLLDDFYPYFEQAINEGLP